MRPILLTASDQHPTARHCALLAFPVKQLFFTNQFCQKTPCTIDTLLFHAAACDCIRAARRARSAPFQAAVVAIFAPLSSPRVAA
jgi:hypothetical protein